MILLHWQWLLVGLLSGTLLMPAVRRYALHYGLSDQPGTRRLHQNQIARGGGASIALVMLGGLLMTQPADTNSVLFIAAFSICALTGWLDDHRPLSPLLKFILLAVSAVVTIVSLNIGNLEEVIIPAVVHDLLPLWIVTGLLIVGLLWLINLYNFMDGSHGLTASQSLLACFAILIFADPVADLNTLCWLLAGALLAFLPWNFPRPGIFLGDVGSLSLGLLIGWLLLGYIAEQALHPLQALLIPGVFLVDSTATLLMRMLQGEAWFKPHTRHAYQCLVHNGWSHTRVFMVYAACNLLLIYPALWLTIKWPAQTATIVLSCFVLLTLLWSIVQLLTMGIRDSIDD